MSARHIARSSMNVGTALIVLVTVTGVVTGAAGCRRSSVGADDDRLPGRTRPLLQHDWAHPRDLRYSANRFTPPDPAKAAVTTASGLRAFVISSADEAVVRMTAVLPLGRAMERAGETGAAELLSRQLSGTLSQRLGASYTGQVQIDQDVDLTTITLEMLRDEWRTGLAGMIGTFRQFVPDERAAAGYRTGSGYAARTRGLGGATFRPAVELARLVSAYPIAPPPPGLTVTASAMRALAARALDPRAIAIGIGGGVSREEAERELQTLTAGWQASAVPGATSAAASSASSAPASAGDTAPRVLAVDEPGFTTWVALGHAVPKLASEDEAAVAVMTEIINVRLNIAVREMRGLANRALLQMSATPRQPGLLHVRTGARPESVAPLIHYAREELTRIRAAAGRATDDELDDAKGSLLTARWQAALDGPRAATATYALESARHGSLDHLLNWPDAVRAIRADDVQRVAARYIHPDTLGTVVIGQLDATRRARHPRWPFALDDVLASR